MLLQWYRNHYTHTHTHTHTQNMGQGNLGAGSGRDQPIVVTDDDKLTTRHADVVKLQNRIREIARVRVSGVGGSM